MVAAKSLVAAALASLACTAAALADTPTVRIVKEDQAKAEAALLHRSDLGVGWTGSAVKPSALSPPNCPGFDPKESDLTVTGHADARFTFAAGGIELDQDVQVLATAAAVESDFHRSISSQLASCLAYQLKQLPNVSEAKVRRMPFPPTGSVSAVYRAVIAVHTSKSRGTLLTDYVFFGQGRYEYEFTIIAPVAAAGELPRFELGLAQILLRRAGLVTA